MAAQPVVIIYRTGEHGGTFRTAYTISLYLDTAAIQGVSGSVTPACWRELVAYFIVNGIKHVRYARRKGDKIKKIERAVKWRW